MMKRVGIGLPFDFKVICRPKATHYPRFCWRSIFLSTYLSTQRDKSLYIQGQHPNDDVKRREYFYYIDHHGMLFLDDSKMKNFTSGFKEKKFLKFFFNNLKINKTSRYPEFPFLSLCGLERNFVRCDDLPIVFTEVLVIEDKNYLSYAHTGDLLIIPFEPERLCMQVETGRIYHPGPETVGAVGQGRYSRGDPPFPEERKCRILKEGVTKWTFPNASINKMHIRRIHPQRPSLWNQYMKPDAIDLADYLPNDLKEKIENLFSYNEGNIKKTEENCLQENKISNVKTAVVIQKCEELSEDKMEEEELKPLNRERESPYLPLLYRIHNQGVEFQQRFDFSEEQIRLSVEETIQDSISECGDKVSHSVENAKRKPRKEKLNPSEKQKKMSDSSVSRGLLEDIKSQYTEDSKLNMHLTKPINRVKDEKNSTENQVTTSAQNLKDSVIMQLFTSFATITFKRTNPDFEIFNEFSTTSNSS